MTGRIAIGVAGGILLAVFAYQLAMGLTVEWRCEMGGGTYFYNPSTNLAACIR